MAKFWCLFDGTAAGPITPDRAYNIVDVTDNGIGDYTVNIDTDFASASYSPYATGGAIADSTSNNLYGIISVMAAGNLRVLFHRDDDTARDEDVEFPDKTFRMAWKRGQGRIDVDMPKGPQYPHEPHPHRA